MARKVSEKFLILLIAVICVFIWYLKSSVLSHAGLHDVRYASNNRSPTDGEGSIQSNAVENYSEDFTVRATGRELPTASSVNAIAKKSYAFELKALNGSCQPFKTFQTSSFCFQNYSLSYVLYDGSVRCLIEGTLSMNKSVFAPCLCKRGWYGPHCSIPQIVKDSNYPSHFGVMLLDQPRRLIYTFPFTIEFDLLEARFAELGDLVDVFVILESTYTASGLAKTRYLFNKLLTGYLKLYQDKIFLVTLPHFPAAAKKDGWIADALIRNYISTKALPNIYGLSNDDIIILSDADELPSREAVLYLKVHYGYPQPVGFSLRHNVFSFAWQGEDIRSVVYGACTVAFLNKFLDGNLYNLRVAPRLMRYDPHRVSQFMERVDSRTQAWNFGDGCGWHCSWCLNAEGIRFKMLAAHFSDLPRWGSMKGKRDLAYLTNITAAGVWFDGKTLLTRVNASDSHFAPKYILANRARYAGLLGRN